MEILPWQTGWGRYIFHRVYRKVLAIRSRGLSRPSIEAPSGSGNREASRVSARLPIEQIQETFQRPISLEHP